MTFKKFPKELQKDSPIYDDAEVFFWRKDTAEKLEELYRKVHDKHYFESEHTRLDKESGYVVSKPQQELVNVLAWIDEELKAFLESLKH